MSRVARRQSLRRTRGFQDHYEEQILGRAFAGTSYLGLRAPVPTSQGVSATASTQGLPPVPTLIASTKSLLPYSSGTGNDKFTQLTPIDRMATRYAIPVVDPGFGTVFTWGVQVTVGYPEGATFTINGEMPEPLHPPYEMADGWYAARYALEPGMYVLEASEPVGVVLGGTSFGLGGGLQP